jgi:hypothetical protein
MSTTTPLGPVNHLHEATGLLYIEGQLEQAAARGVVAHLEQCGPCRLLLDALKRESLLLSHALEEDEEAVPARLLALRPSQGVSWGWLAVFALAATGVYTLWTLYVEPWMASLQDSGFGGQFFFTWLLLNGAFWKGWNDMLRFVELGSLGVLASVLVLVFRRRLRRISSVSVFLAALLAVLAALAAPPAAQAAEFVKNKMGYEVRTGETVHKDLFVVSSAVRIAGTIDGDLFCFCHTLTIEGQVNGDVFAFANNVLITGKVNGSVRSFNENFTLEGDVGRNVLSFVSQFRTTSRANIAGSATLFVGHMELEGPLGKDLSAFLGDGSVNGAIGGDVWIHQGSGHHLALLVAPRADVKGSFQFKGPQRPEISSAAKLASTPEVEIVAEPPDYLRTSSYRYNALIWGAGFLVGLVLISVAPGFAHDATREVARIWAPLGFGLVTFIVMPFAAVLACITVVGLGLGIPTFLLWLFLIFFAQIFAAAWLGEVMLGASSGTWPLAGRLALGLLVLRLATLTPYVGVWLRFVACVMGMGALTLVVYRRLGSPAAPPQSFSAPIPAVPGD